MSIILTIFANYKQFFIMQKKVKRKRKTKLNIGRFLVLYSLGYSDRKIAEHFKVSVSNVAYLRHTILKLSPIKESYVLNKEQEEIIVGTLLGDSYIGYVHNDCLYPNLTFSHCKKQELYAKQKFNKLKNIMSSITERQYHKTAIIKGRFCKLQPVLYARSRNCKCLEKYRTIFYPEGKKIIPIDFLEKTFTAQSLAYLFMDDGCKNQESYNLNLQCFEIENLYQFTDFLRRKFNLEFIVKKDKTLYLRYKSVKTFENLIFNYLTQDMMYKFHSSHLKTS